MQQTKDDSRARTRRHSKSTNTADRNVLPRKARLALKGALMIVAFGLFSIPALAQTGSFTGRVTDTTGGVIPGAHITVHNEQTGVDLKTVTTSTGDYTITYLNPGSYTVIAEATGFGKSQKSISICRLPRLPQSTSTCRLAGSRSPLS